MTQSNKKPILLRILFCIATLAVFTYSMWPFTERDFTETLKEKIVAEKVNDPKIKAIFEDVQQMREKSPEMTESAALLIAADKQQVNLAEYIDASTDVQNTKDVISIVKRDIQMSIRLGIDLRGGVEFLVSMLDDAESENQKLSAHEKCDKARELIRERLEKIGIFESEISEQAGGAYLSIKAPVVSKEEKDRIQHLIEQAAKLRFRHAYPLPENDPEVLRYIALVKEGRSKEYRPLDPNIQDYEMMISTERAKKNDKVKGSMNRYYLVKKKAEMTGSNIEKAFVHTSQFGQLEIILNFNGKGAKEFADVSRRFVNRHLAIVLDGKLYSAPVINEAIVGGRAQITGDFSQEEAESVANALSSGNLPFNMKVIGIFEVDPTLGKDNVKSGMITGIISLVITALFMGIYYLKSGWIANIALIANIVLVLGAMAAFKQTLTLPGIAGIILTIGMAVDANVLINERIREEIASGKSIFHAIELGYSRAFLTILDSNLTTLWMGIILLFFGTGAVKGFAISLSIGIVTSMFTALMMTRIVFDCLARFDRPKKLTMFSILPNCNCNFVKQSRYALIGSLVLIIASLGIMGWKGKDGFSIDFTGGEQFSFHYNEEFRLSDNEINEAFQKANISNYRFGYKNNSTQKIFEVMLGTKGDDVQNSNMKETIAQILNAVKPGFLEKDPAGAFKCEVREIGGLVGYEFAKSSLYSIIFACIGIILYVTLRFEMVYAAGATLALLHDIIITTGFFLATGGQISLTVIAALLTLYGYSINDTIVIFDRIREQVKLYPEKTFKQIINDSINETLPRTIITSITVIFSLVVLLIGGGIALQDFSVVMLFGCLIGTYSSVYVASPLVYIWHKKFGIKHDDDIQDPEVVTVPTVATAEITK